MTKKLLFFFAILCALTSSAQETVSDPTEVTDKIMGGDVTSSVNNWQVEFTGTEKNGQLYRNTWSSEGSEDYSSMAAPFIENYVFRDSHLSDQLNHIDTVDVEPGAYKITARVRMSQEGGDEKITGGYLFGNFQRKEISSDPCYYYDICSAFDPKAETYAVVGDDGKLTFGLQVVNANYNWLAFKDFHIYYLGKSDHAVTTARNSDMMPLDISENTLITNTFKDDLNGFVETYKTSSAAEEIMAMVSNITSLMKEAKENMAAWAKLKSLYDRIYGELSDVDIMEDIDDMPASYQEWFYSLSDLLSEDQVYFEELTLTTQQVKDAYETLLNKYYDRPIVPRPCYFLENRDFSDGRDNWTWEFKGSGGQLMPDKNNCLADSWNASTFDVHQNAEGPISYGFILPAGIYKLTVNGFYRYSRLDTAWMEYFNEDGTKKTAPIDVIKTSPVVVYMNDFTKPLANYFDYSTDPAYAKENWALGTYYTDPLQECCYPQSGQDVKEAFSRGQYLNTVYCVIANDGDSIRVGVKGSTNQVGDSEAMFSNFKMTFMGYDYDAAKQLLHDTYSEYAGSVSDEAREAFSNLLIEIENAGTVSASDIKRIADAVASLKNNVTAVESVTSSGEPSRTEYYMLDGTRSLSLKQGLNIIRSVGSDGKVTVRKQILR